MKSFLCAIRMIVGAGLIGSALMGCGGMAAKDSSATSDMSSYNATSPASEASRKLHMGY